MKKVERKKFSRRSGELGFEYTYTKELRKLEDRKAQKEIDYDSINLADLTADSNVFR